MSDNLQNISDNELYQMLMSDKKAARKAFEELYARFSPKIYTYCRKFTNNRNLAEDIFQEVFIQLHTESQKRTIIKNVSAFLLTVARNKCLNENQRVANNFSSIDNIDLGYTQNDKLESDEISNIVNLAINALPEQYKEVIIMKEHLDMSYKEIADATKQSLTTVRIRIYRAKEKLRELLEPYIKDLQN